MPLLLVRHAAAGERSEWRGDDRERPLDTAGTAQADALVALLEPLPITAIYSSPYRRCVQTIEPLASVRGLPIEQCDELGEERQATDGIELVRSLAAKDVVVCGHGGLEAALVDPPKWRKGSTFVVDDNLRVETVLRPRTGARRVR
jgi:phosphohistidine phosphatase SixA